MRIEKTNVCQVLLNKVTNEYLFVVGVDDTFNEAIAGPFPNELLNAAVEDIAFAAGRSISEGREVRITKANDICFRFIKDLRLPIIPDISEYSVKDGILVKSGEPVCEQGEIKVVEILGVLPDNLVLLTVYRDKTYVYNYNVHKDEFRRMAYISHYTTIKALDNNENRVLLTINSTDPKQLTVNGEIVTEVVCHSSIMSVSPCDCYITSIHGLAPTDAEDIVNIADDTFLIVVRQPAEPIMDDDGCSFYVLPDEAKDKTDVYRWIANDKENKLTLEETFTGDVRVLTGGYYSKIVYVSSSLVKTNGESFVPTEKMVTEILSHPVLVDISSHDRVTTWTFANKKAEVYKVEVTRTRDRGVLMEECIF